MASDGSGEGYPHSYNADETRQAAQGVMNDATLDVNMNAAVTRSQHLTIDALGKGFVASQERRQILADAAMNKQITT